MENKDLVWDLDKFKAPQRAKEFVLGIENKLCIYSESLRQLYANYNIFFPQEEGRKLVILPNPYAHQDTFHGIDGKRLRPTGLLMLPMVEEESRGALGIILPMKSSQSIRKIPIATGLHLIQQKLPSKMPFLPVLKKGDLRELGGSGPCLHLHLLLASNLAHDLPMSEVQDIQWIIQDRLKQLTQLS